MRSEEPSKPDTAEPPLSWARRRRIRTMDLMQGAREVIIVHQGEEYILRVTKSGKLILTK